MTTYNIYDRVKCHVAIRDKQLSGHDVINLATSQDPAYAFKIVAIDRLKFRYVLTPIDAIGRLSDLGSKLEEIKDESLKIEVEKYLPSRRGFFICNEKVFIKKEKYPIQWDIGDNVDLWFDKEEFICEPDEGMFKKPIKIVGRNTRSCVIKHDPSLYKFRKSFVSLKQIGEDFNLSQKLDRHEKLYSTVDVSFFLENYS